MAWLGLGRTGARVVKVARAGLARDGQVVPIGLGRLGLSGRGVDLHERPGRSACALLPCDPNLRRAHQGAR